MSTPPPLPSSCCAPLDRSPGAEWFRALGDPVRLMLVGMLAGADRPLTVSEAMSCCGVHLSGVSRHLALLERAGIVERDKHGREVRYRLRAGDLAHRLRALADAIEACPCGTSTCCSPSSSASPSQELS